MRLIMQLIVSALSAALSSSMLLQAYFFWAASSFVPFDEFLILLLYAGCLVVPLFFAIALPFLWCLRRGGLRVPWSQAVLMGAVLGLLVMSLFLVITNWPLRLPELVSGAVGGACGLGAYELLGKIRGSSECMQKERDIQDNEAEGE